MVNRKSGQQRAGIPGRGTGYTVSLLLTGYSLAGRYSVQRLTTTLYTAPHHIASFAATYARCGNGLRCLPCSWGPVVQKLAEPRNQEP